MALSEAVPPDIEFRKCKHDDRPKVVRRKIIVANKTLGIAVCHECSELPFYQGEEIPL